MPPASPGLAGGASTRCPAHSAPDAQSQAPNTLRPRALQDGTPTSFRVIGKMQMPGQLERPVAKYHGREVEVQTEKAVLLFRITDS